MSRNAHIELAHVAMHPDRRKMLLDKHGSPQSVLRRIRTGNIVVPDEARAAADVPAEARIEMAHEMGYTMVVRGDVGYPSFMARLPDAPDVLFCKGVIPRRAGVAVVGTRRCTTYGKDLAFDFGSTVARAGWVVVSGLAYGIDEAAHHGTVSVGGIGTAVLGSGIDHWYPRRNAQLGRKLIEGGGAVISEYPPGIRPAGWRFPPRNRIISALSAVTVVVEAAATGGALITARYAVAHGREVFAVPGDVDRPTSEGTNRLIRDGAWPVFGCDDLVESIERIMACVA